MSRTLTAATTYSDNSVFAQVAKKVGTKKIAQLARKMGVRTPVSSNLAMALGGLRTGVTPLDMAHAYETFATGGNLIYGTLSPGQSHKSLPVPGPVGIERIEQLKGNKQRPVELDDGTKLVNRFRHRRVLNAGLASEVGTILQTVVKQGSGTRAQIPGVMVAGKTGTTEDYGDAWFVAWTKEYTVAVWVGYPDKFKPMKTEFAGGPVAGGTYPAQIWKTFMQALLKIDPLPKADGGDGTGKPDETPTPVGDGTGVAAPTAAPPTSTVAPGTGGTGTGGAGHGRHRRHHATREQAADPATHGISRSHRGPHDAARRHAAAGYGERRRRGDGRRDDGLNRNPPIPAAPRRRMRGPCPIGRDPKGHPAGARPIDHGPGLRSRGTTDHRLRYGTLVAGRPRADPSVRDYRTGLLPWVLAANRCSGQGCRIRG